MSRNLPSWSHPNGGISRRTHQDLNLKILPTVGGGRSFGDANFLGNQFASCANDKLMSLDTETGEATFSGSVSILDAINYLAQYKRTLVVIPGTMHATIGGCIASDIHGKNSHRKGPFSQHVSKFTLETKLGPLVVSDPDCESWKCTVGGQGLTGRIIEASVQTEELTSIFLLSTVIRTKNLEEHFEILHKRATEHDFAVGWIDGDTPGFKEKGFIEFCDEPPGPADGHYEGPKSGTLWKSYFPRIKVVNWGSIWMFNLMNHGKSMIHSRKKRRTSRWNYMFPMAGLGNWNYFFGQSGFHEVQFSFSQENIVSAIRLIREIISEQRIFLIGVKVMSGKQNGYLAFPGQEWSVAVNFPASSSTPSEVRRYQDQISQFGGRINPTKDWCADDRVFQVMFPNWQKITEFRKNNDIIVESNFSKRVGITY
jgi:decaprenylphospho-beta-D-ribofuranose 2-oxidase